MAKNCSCQVAGCIFRSRQKLLNGSQLFPRRFFNKADTFTFVIHADHPLYDRIESGDRLDIFAVPRSVKEVAGAPGDFAEYDEQLIASNKLTSGVFENLRPQQPNTKAISVELSGSEVQNIGQFEKVGYDIEFRAHDLNNELVHDRRRMKGVWRMVYFRVLGNDLTADVKNQVGLITGRDLVLFRDEGNDRISMEMKLDDDDIELKFQSQNQTAMCDVLYRFLENGRLEFAFNDISMDPDGKLPLNFEDAQILMRLERVETPQTENQRLAFAALDSLDTAQIKLEMYLVQRNQEVGELPDSFKRGKVESTGEAVWHGPTPIITNRDLVSAEVADEDEPYQRLLIELSDAGAQRARPGHPKKSWQTAGDLSGWKTGVCSRDYRTDLAASGHLGQL